MCCPSSATGIVKAGAEVGCAPGVEAATGDTTMGFHYYDKVGSGVGGRGRGGSGRKPCLRSRGVCVFPSLPSSLSLSPRLARTNNAYSLTRPLSRAQESFADRTEFQFKVTNYDGCVSSNCLVCSWQLSVDPALIASGERVGAAERA